MHAYSVIYILNDILAVLPTYTIFSWCIFFHSLGILFQCGYVLDRDGGCFALFSEGKIFCAWIVCAFALNAREKIILKMELTTRTYS